MEILPSQLAAWRQAPKVEGDVETHSNDDPSKAHRYSLCIDSLKAAKHLTDSQRLLLGKTYFTLQQFEPPADALAEVQGVTNENAEARYWLARTYQARGRDPIHNKG